MDKTLAIGCGIVGGLAAPAIIKAAKAVRRSDYGPLVESLVGVWCTIGALAAITPTCAPMTCAEYWRNFS